MPYQGSERDRTAPTAILTARDRHHRDERSQRAFLSSGKEKDRKRPKSAERNLDPTAYSSQVGLLNKIN